LIIKKESSQLPWAVFQERYAKNPTDEFSRTGILNDFPSTLQIVNWAYTQTFECHGKTWYRSEELQELPPDWNASLKRFLN